VLDICGDRRKKCIRRDALENEDACKTALGHTHRLREDTRNTLSVIDAICAADLRKWA
jgi:hypothetical protein